MRGVYRILLNKEDGNISMILGIDELHKLVKEKKLVENLCERELSNPEGVGFDIRIKDLYELDGEGFLGVEERDTPDMKLVASYDPDETTTVTLKPGKYYLMSTIESVNTPENLLGLFSSRTTLFRCGVRFISGELSPGYCGPLTFALINLSDKDFKLELGARVAHVNFFEVKGSANMYRGQWQGGRVTTDGVEKQV